MIRRRHSTGRQPHRLCAASPQLLRRALLRGSGLGLGLSMAGLPGLALGQAASAAAAPASAPPLDTAHWLSRVQQAAATRSYQGTVVYTGAGVVSSSRVLHIGEGSQRYQRVDVLDGLARSQFRHNDVLLTQWPASRRAVLSHTEPVVDFPGLPNGAAQRAVDNYELRPLGTDRVAGHEADVLMVKPRDNLRYAQRWWVARDSGLLLRADTLGSRGEVLDSSAFTDVVVDVAGLKPHAIVSAIKRLAGWQVQRTTVQRAQLDQEGWSMSRQVPGFQQVNCTRRPLEGAIDDNTPVLQTVFSDGLTHVSLFIEPYAGPGTPGQRQPLSTQMGATHTLAARQGDWWVTLVGDVPMTTLRQFAAALERRR